MENVITKKSQMEMYRKMRSVWNTGWTDDEIESMAQADMDALDKQECIARGAY